MYVYYSFLIEGINMKAINESFKMCSQKDSGLEMYSIKVNTVVEHSNQVKP